MLAVMSLLFSLPGKFLFAGVMSHVLKWKLWQPYWGYWSVTIHYVIMLLIFRCCM